jgi:hypothetical protein
MTVRRSPFEVSAAISWCRTEGRFILPVVARDWWWPWWISSLIDVGIVVLAVIVFVRANRRLVRQIATLVGIGAIVAAGLAPVVMKGKASNSPMRMQTGNTMTMTTP